MWSFKHSSTKKNHVEVKHLHHQYVQIKTGDNGDSCGGGILITIAKQ